MSSPQFTPGPWVIGWGDGKTGPTCPSSSGPTVAGRDHRFEIVGAGFETYAIVPAPERGGSPEPNARLIAAAPDLFAAAEAALPHLEAALRAVEATDREVLGKPGLNLALKTTITDTRAALAKVRGDA